MQFGFYFCWSKFHSPSNFGCIRRRRFKTHIHPIWWLNCFKMFRRPLIILLNSFAKNLAKKWLNQPSWIKIKPEVDPGWTYAQYAWPNVHQFLLWSIGHNVIDCIAMANHCMEQNKDINSNPWYRIDFLEYSWICYIHPRTHPHRLIHVQTAFDHPHWPKSHPNGNQCPKYSRDKLELLKIKLNCKMVVLNLHSMPPLLE